jgi:hypothetical protein
MTTIKEKAIVEVAIAIRYNRLPMSNSANKREKHLATRLSKLNTKCNFVCLYPS